MKTTIIFQRNGGESRTNPDYGRRWWVLVSFEGTGYARFYATKPTRKQVSVFKRLVASSQPFKRGDYQFAYNLWG